MALSVELSEEIISKAGKSRVLYKEKKFSEGLDLLNACIQLKPDDALLLFEQSCFLYQLGQFEQSITALERSINITPNSRNHSFLGSILADLGKPSEAAFHYLQAFKFNPSNTYCAYAMAYNGDYEVNGEEYQIIHAALQRNAQQPIDYARLNMALGKIHLKNKDVPGALSFFHAGKKISEKFSNYDLSADTLRTQKIISAFKALEYEEMPTSTVSNKSTRVALIFGLPRSGTTLLETMLNSHTDIQGIGESKLLSSSLEHLAHQFNEEMFQIEHLSKCTAQDWKNSGQQMIEQVNYYGKRWIVDKQLFNYVWLGCAQKLNPDSVFIDIRRNPADIFISCYGMLFGVWPNYTHSVDSFIVAYNNYHLLVTEWKKLFPQNIVTIYYEQLVEKPYENLVKILDKLELPFEEECLDFYKTEAPIFTPSQQQVRKPLYKSSIGAWSRFENHFPEAAEKLNPLINRYLDELQSN